MAEAARDDNRVTSLIGVSSTDGTTTLKAYIDPTTNRLLVNAVGTITGQQYTDGDTDATPTGTLSMGWDGTDTVYAQLVDSDGHLQVDVLSGGGGTDYTEDVAAPSPVVAGSLLSVRDDALSTVTPVEGDWIRLRGTAEGALWTQDFNSDAILADTTTIAGVVGVVGGGTEAAALRVTIANDSTGVLSVDDNGNSLTVDTTGTAGLEVVQSVAADLNVTEASASAIKTSVEIIDNTILVDRAAFTWAGTSVSMIGAVYDTTPTAPLDGAAGALRINADRSLEIHPAGTTLANGQVSVDTTAGGTTILAASAGRAGAVITNHGTTDCFIGTGSVTTSNGFLLGGGESVGIPTDSDIKGIVASTTVTISYLSYA